ncbi:MAG: potassium-transporting ATPase subunit KdpC [Acidimicrobiales bacterium]
MRRTLWTSIALTVVMTVLTGLAYPLVVTGIAQGLLHHQANGSLVAGPNGQIVGSELVGQSFSDPNGNPLPIWFQPRLSAAGTGYDAMSSSGSNLGPTNPALISAVTSAMAAYRTFNRLSATTPVPVDAVTSSGSGLDPEISIANARLQVPRVAAVRGLPLAQVQHLVDQATVGRVLGVMGEPGVNVLDLNLSLARLGSR